MAPGTTPMGCPLLVTLVDCKLNRSTTVPPYRHHHTLQHSLDKIYTWSEDSMLKLNVNEWKTVMGEMCVYRLHILLRWYYKDSEVISDDQLNFQRHCYEKNKQSLAC